MGWLRDWTIEGGATSSSLGGKDRQNVFHYENSGQVSNGRDSLCQRESHQNSCVEINVRLQLDALNIPKA